MSAGVELGRSTRRGGLAVRAVASVAAAAVAISGFVALAARLAIATGAALAAEDVPVVVDDGAVVASAVFRFEALDLFIDSGSTPLAAWQVEVSSAGGTARAVATGVEGGVHAAYREAPYYDPAALEGSRRLALAAFRADGELPSGATRVARIHFAVEGDGDPGYRLRLVTAGDAAGRNIGARAWLRVATEESR